MPRARARVGLTRRHLRAGGLAAPLLPAPLLAAASRPRFRRRRKTPPAAFERQHFTSDRPPTAAAMQTFIERLWRRLEAAAGGTRPPWRQYDLLAGLALRYGRAELLPLLAAHLPVGSPRAAKWLREGRWRRRWSAAPSLRWSWPEGGDLTRRALPLTLPD